MTAKEKPQKPLSRTKSDAAPSHEVIALGNRPLSTNHLFLAIGRSFPYPPSPRSKEAHSALVLQRSVSSVVERLLHTQDVTSSNLVPTTISLTNSKNFRIA